MNIEGKFPLETEIVGNRVITTYKDFEICTEVNLPLSFRSSQQQEYYDREAKINIQHKLRNLMYPEKLGGMGAFNTFPKDFFDKERVFHYEDGIWKWRELKVFVGKPIGVGSRFDEMGCGIVGVLTPSLIQFEGMEISASSVVFIQEVEDYVLQ